MNQCIVSSGCQVKLSRPKGIKMGASFAPGGSSTRDITIKQLSDHRRLLTEGAIREIRGRWEKLNTLCGNNKIPVGDNVIIAN
jgi:hypothetical protein